jgi:hypothetical protein
MSANDPKRTLVTEFRPLVKIAAAGLEQDSEVRISDDSTVAHDVVGIALFVRIV